jgi:hypothetical protein
MSSQKKLFQIDMKLPKVIFIIYLKFREKLVRFLKSLREDSKGASPLSETSVILKKKTRLFKKEPSPRKLCIARRVDKKTESNSKPFWSSQKKLCVIALETRKINFFKNT